MALTLKGGTSVSTNYAHNPTAGKGGGVYFGKGTLTLGGATITDNTAATGPSIYRRDTGTSLVIVPDTTNTYEDVTGP